MIIGAQKSGTSSLTYLLGQHPQICFCKKKEPHFFSMSRDWKAELAYFHGLFTPSQGQLCGEASTSYTFLPKYQHVASRLFEYNPELKLIYIMRHPIERIFSHYKHRVVRGVVKDSIEDEVLKNDAAYVNISRYGLQIRQYSDLFPKKNLLLLIFEEFVSDSAKTLEQIAKFLGISSSGFFQIDKTPRNVAPQIEYLKRFPGAGLAQSLLRRVPFLENKTVRKLLYTQHPELPELSHSLSRTLWKLLEDDVRTVEELMGRRLDIWRNYHDE